MRTVVIDAGHGGRDPGCVGLDFKEKDIALSIALKVGQGIQRLFPNVKVIYTRSEDVFVELDRRAEIANENGADLFLSIHCNAIAHHKNSVSGTETFVMGNHVLEENLEVAKRENEAVLFEDGYVKKYDGYNPESPAGHILLSMFQNANIEKSLIFATLVDECLKKRAGRPSRGVMQAGFVVLRKTTMPSALIEVGYLSNPTEEKYLGSEAGQIQLAASIVEAFRQYKTAIEGRSAPNIDRPAPSPTTQQTTAPSNLPVAAQSTDPIVWYVQLASSEIPLSIREGVWLNVPKLISEKVEKHHVYLTGPHEKYESALDGQEYWQRNGFPDALLVPYSNGRRISWEEANRKP